MTVSLRLSAPTHSHASGMCESQVNRAGRFNTKGLAISFISTPEDSKVLEAVQARFEVEIKELPEQIDSSSYMTA